MAIFHTSIKTFSRGRGQSAVAAAAYRGGLLLMDLLTGQQHDYRFDVLANGAPSAAAAVQLAPGGNAVAVCDQQHFARVPRRPDEIERLAGVILRRARVEGDGVEPPISISLNGPNPLSQRGLGWP